ncbi:MAG: choice-of-anchor Q domain-containing protein [Anaerolineae bacterium]|nr:choice-of-anchor Q domain-containing protein [Anaerolineae bacterium]
MDTRTSRFVLLVLVSWVAMLAPGMRLSAVALPSATLSATVRYVAPAGACGGVTPCYATIQAAVDAAAAGDEIRVAAGTYSGVTARGGSTQVVYLDKALTLRGGFTTANWTTPNPAANSTTVDAQGLGRGLVISGAQSAVTVEGLRITGGNATGLGGYPGGQDAGGGVYVARSAATLRHCSIYNNTASTSATATARGYGGGVAAIYSTLTLESSTVENNRASTGNSGYGGGLLVLNDAGWGGPVTLTNNTFRANIGSTTSSGAGGGIWLGGCTGTLTSNTIRDNWGTTAAGRFGEGGGVYAEACDLTLGNNTVQDNRAGAGGSGGGLYFSDVAATLTGNQIVGNRAGDGKSGNGGGLYAASDPETRAGLILRDNTFRANLGCRNSGPTSVLCRGGGLRLSRVVATLTGNIIEDNIALSGAVINDNGRGGGISLYEPLDTTLTGNTVRGNVACSSGFGFGGGIELQADLARSDAIVLSANTVQSNTASLAHTGYGGGIFTSNVSGTLSSNVVTGNTASRGKEGYGGGVYAEGGSLTVRDNTVEGNVASTADRGVGGGLRFGSASQPRTVAILTGNRIRNNIGSTAATNSSSFRSGSGGLELWLTSGAVTQNIITGNTGATAQAAYCGGAAIHTGDQAVVTFSGNTVADNVAGTDGSAGGGLCLNGAVTASDNTINGNRAATAGAGRGGGVVLGLSPEGSAVGGPVALEGNRIQGNTAGATGDGRGGGVYVSRNLDRPDDAFSISGNLIADNVASQGGAGRGGGIYLGASHAARLNANRIIGNRASQAAGAETFHESPCGDCPSTSEAPGTWGGGVYIVNSHEFSLINNVVARNRAAEGSGLWVGGNLDNPSDAFPAWGRFLHTTLADNQGGAGALLASPLRAGTLTDAYSGGVQVLVSAAGFYRAGDDLLFIHTNGTTRAWRRLVALESLGSKVRLTLDSALPTAYPVGSTVRDAAPMFVNTIVAGQTVGIAAVDQAVKLVNTLWHGNGTDRSDNLNAILTQGDVTGDPMFVGAAAGDYHIAEASAACDRGVDAGVRSDLDGQVRPSGAGYDIGADEYAVSRLYLPLVVRR